jgi:hypothetical protein
MFWFLLVLIFFCGFMAGVIFERKHQPELEEDLNEGQE